MAHNSFIISTISDIQRQEHGEEATEGAVRSVAIDRSLQKLAPQAFACVLLPIPKAGLEIQRRETTPSPLDLRPLAVMKCHVLHHLHLHYSNFDSALN